MDNSTNNKSTKINPRLLQGFRDFLPKQKRQRDWLIDQVRAVYESFGFQPLETPALEYADILAGKYGDEGQKLMYRFKDHGAREVALRYDLTVPFVRVIAQYPELVKPFKRYQVAPAWRAENTQAGRFREFYQMDADIAGSASMMADAEMVSLISATMTKLGISNFNIRLNNRKILNGLIAAAKIDEAKASRVFALIDKMEKISTEDLEKSLNDILDADQTKKVLAFTQIQGSNTEILTVLKSIFGGIEIGQEGTKELAEVLDCLDKTSVDQAKIRIDLSIVRGLDYYTGTVYETTLLDLAGFGSVFSGGRFDKLIGNFSGIDLPAVGASVGVDRLFAAMEKLELLPPTKNTVDALVTVFPENPSDSLKVAQNLRQVGLNIEIYLGTRTDLKSQLNYADKLAIPVVVITFPDQVKNNKYLVKKMGAALGEAEQTETDFETLAATVQALAPSR